MEIGSCSRISMEHECIEMPPGFRFHPTDEELIICYLKRKVVDNNFNAIAIGDANMNNIEPWDLPKKAKLVGKEWYFFVVRDRKYPTGLRTNRATHAGYWKATGKDKEIFNGESLIGMKKTLVFYIGRAPKGEKTNWVMHEYRLDGKYAKFNHPKNDKNEWAISRVFQKRSDAKTSNDQDLVESEELQTTSLQPFVSSSSMCNNDQANLFHMYNFFSPLVAQNQHSTGDAMDKHELAPATPLYSVDSSLSYMLMDQDMGDFQYLDSIFDQDLSSMLKLLNEDHNSNLCSSSKVELPPETIMCCDGAAGMNNTLDSSYGSDSETAYNPAGLCDADSFLNLDD